MNDLSQNPSKKGPPGKALVGSTRSLLEKVSAGSLDATGQVETSIERPRQIGIIIAVLVFGFFGLWSVLVPIDGAAHAPGVITVRSYKKIVQHLEGGIVKQIMVDDGDHVNAGDVLLELDSTQSLSQLEILNGQLLTLTALEARMIAERDGKDSVSYPAILQDDSQGKQEIAAQNQVFETRKATREGSKAVLEQRVSQLQSSLDGMQSMLKSRKELAASYQDELDDFKSLLDEGFADKQRLRELERNHAQQEGEAGNLTAQIATAQIQIGETKLQILQQDNEFQTKVADELAQTQAKLKDVKERITALQDIVRRTTVRAPVAGVVNNLRVHTQGGVIPPGSEIAEIVPQTDELIIEARVLPTDIDRVAVGQVATVRLSAYNSRVVPTLHGTVINLSPDTMHDSATHASFYLARIELTPDSMHDLRDKELIPGMPAEIFITTGSRTFLEYLLKPLTNAAARSFRED